MGILVRDKDETTQQMALSTGGHKKKDPKDVRLTVDLRLLNDNTIRPVCTAASPRQAVCRLDPEAKFFLVFNGPKGFYQVDLGKSQVDDVCGTELWVPEVHANAHGLERLIRCVHCLHGQGIR